MINKRVLEKLGIKEEDFHPKAKNPTEENGERIADLEDAIMILSEMMFMESEDE